jgi:hypothetical protein
MNGWKQSPTRSVKGQELFGTVIPHGCSNIATMTDLSLRGHVDNFRRLIGTVSLGKRRLPQRVGVTPGWTAAALQGGRRRLASRRPAVSPKKRAPAAADVA